jgi:hypothetical protein
MASRKQVKDTKASQSIMASTDNPVTFIEIPVSKLKCLPVLHCRENTGAHTPETVFPIVVGKITGKTGFYVIDGCKRLKILKDGKKKIASCAVLINPADEKTLGLMRIKLNRGRSFSMHEKIGWLKWATALKDNAVSCRVLEDMGLTNQDLTMYSPLFSAGEHIIEALESGALHPSAARSMLILPIPDQKEFLRAFKGAGLSFQTQREFVEWLTDMHFSAKQSVRDIFSLPEIKSILENAKLNWPQKIQKVRDILFEMKYPVLVRVRDKWNKAASSANSGLQSVRFIPDAFFEKDRLEVRCTVTSPEKASELFGKLASIPADTWSILINPSARV